MHSMAKPLLSPAVPPSSVREGSVQEEVLAANAELLHSIAQVCAYV